MEFIIIGVERAVLEKVIGKKLPPSPHSDIYLIRYQKGERCSGSVGYFEVEHMSQAKSSDWKEIRTISMGRAKLWKILKDIHGQTEIVRSDCTRTYIIDGDLKFLGLWEHCSVNDKKGTSCFTCDQNLQIKEVRFKWLKK